MTRREFEKALLVGHSVEVELPFSVQLSDSPVSSPGPASSAAKQQTHDRNKESLLRTSEKKLKAETQKTRTSCLTGSESNTTSH